MMDVAGLRLGGTPASGGVRGDSLDRTRQERHRAAVRLEPAAGERFAYFQRCGYDDSTNLAQQHTLSWDARFVLPGAWRVGPRFSVERAQ